MDNIASILGHISSAQEESLMHMEGGQSCSTEEAGVIDSQREGKGGFAVTADDSVWDLASPGKGNTVNVAGTATLSTWTVSNETEQYPAKSTLNPDAKEFHLPVWSADYPFSSPSVDVQVLLHNHTLACSRGQVPSMALPWPASKTSDTNDSIFSHPAQEEVSKWSATVPSICIPMRDGSGGVGVGVGRLTAPVHMTPRTAAAQIAKDFEQERRNGDFHVVVVFNLEPRTSKDDLLGIFFPMNAKKAEILPQSQSMRPNRRAGVVFFPSKAFAEVAVEKFNDFVPNGQHQPLTVIYCPDALSEDEEKKTRATVVQQRPAATSQAVRLHNLHQPAWATSSRPWRLPQGRDLDQVHNEMWRSVQNVLFKHTGVTRHFVAVHGLDPEKVEDVISRNFVRSGEEQYNVWTPGLCRSLSALVWYEEEARAMEILSLFQSRPPDGQVQPVETVYLNRLFGTYKRNTNAISPHPQMFTITRETQAANMPLLDTSNLAFDKIDEFFLRNHGSPELHLVAVHNLPPQMDKKSLLRLFSRHGALSAEIFPNPIRYKDGVCSSGVVLFDNESVACEAADKLNNFHFKEQSTPIFTRHLVRPSPVPVADEGMQGVDTLSNTVKKLASESMGNALVNASNSALLTAVIKELYASVVNADQLAEKMYNLVVSPDATMAMAEHLASVIVNILKAFGHHAQALSTPLVNALLALHEKLNIPRRGSRETAGLESGEGRNSPMARNVIFVGHIARALLQLLMDNKQPDEPRKVAAVLSAYLFQYCYLKKSPYELAVKIMTENEEKLRRAREFEQNRQMSVKPAAQFSCDCEEETNHKPWLTMLACLDELTSVWRRNNRSRAKKDPHRKEYERRLDELVPGGSTQAGGSASLNASARPTPRRVIAKVTPGSGTGTSTSSPGVTLASPPSMHTNTRSGMGDANSASQDVSLDNGSSYIMTPHSVFGADQSIPSVCTRQTNSAQTGSTASQKQKNAQTRTQAESTGGSDSGRPLPGPRAGGHAHGVYSQSELMERTVYITKLPSTLRRAQFRRLLMHFGELNKVRLCRDDNQPTTKDDKTLAGACTLGIQGSAGSLWFSFVEFADPSGAKAMIEYFRNAIFGRNPLGFLLESVEDMPASSHFTAQDIQTLLNLRTSPARNPIHDQLPLDAVLTATHQPHRHVVRNAPCRFGLEFGDKTIDSPLEAPISSSSNSPATVVDANAWASVIGGRHSTGAATVTSPVGGTSLLAHHGRHPNPRTTSTVSFKVNSDIMDDDCMIDEIVDKGINHSSAVCGVKGDLKPSLMDDETTLSFDSIIREMGKTTPCQGDPHGSFTEAAVGDGLACAIASGTVPQDAVDSAPAWLNIGFIGDTISGSASITDGVTPLPSW